MKGHDSILRRLASAWWVEFLCIFSLGMFGYQQFGYVALAIAVIVAAAVDLFVRLLLRVASG